MDFTKSEILAAGGFIIAASAALWKMLLSAIKKDKDDLDQCRKDKMEILEEVRSLDAKYNYLKGKMDGVEALSISVIKKIDDVRLNKTNGD